MLFDQIRTGLLDGSIVVEMNGHCGPRDFSEVPDEYGGPSRWARDWAESATGSMSYHLRQMLKAKQGGLDLTTSRASDLSYPDLTLDEIRAQPVSADSLESCAWCGMRLRVVFEGDRFRVTSDPCPATGGVGVYAVRLAIPSGKIVFGNDFRSLVLDFTHDEHHGDGPQVSVNSAVGKKAFSEFYEQRSLALIFTGNSCPSVYQHAPTHLSVEMGEADERSGLGYICTDLWWYSAMDLDVYDRLKRETGRDPFAGGWPEPVIATVEPGMYEFSSHYHAMNDEPGERFVISEIRKISG